MDNTDLEILRKNPSWNISIEEYRAVRDELPASFSTTDVLMRVFNKQISSKNPYTDWGQLRCIYLNMGDALYKLERDTKRAVPYWFCAVLFDINTFVGEVLWANTFGIPLSDIPLDSIDREPYFLPQLVKYLRRDIQTLSEIKIEKTPKPPCINWIYTAEDYALILDAIVNENPFRFEFWNSFCAQRTRSFLAATANKSI